MSHISLFGLTFTPRPNWFLSLKATPDPSPLTLDNATTDSSPSALPSPSPPSPAFPPSLKHPLPPFEGKVPAAPTPRSKVNTENCKISPAMTLAEGMALSAVERQFENDEDDLVILFEDGSSEDQIVSEKIIREYWNEKLPIASHPPRPPSSQSPSNSAVSTVQTELEFFESSLDDKTSISCSDDSVILQTDSSRISEIAVRPLECQAVSSTPLHPVRSQTTVTAVPPMPIPSPVSIPLSPTTSISSISAPPSPTLMHETSRSSNSLACLNQSASVDLETFPDPPPVEDLEDSSIPTSAFTFRRRWSFLKRFSLSSPPDVLLTSLDDSDKSSKPIGNVASRRSHSLPSPAPSPKCCSSKPMSPVTPLALSPVSAICDRLSRLQLEIMDTNVLKSINAQLGKISFDSVRSYYRERPDLGNFTAETDLLRANYQIVTPHSEPVTDAAEVSKIYSENLEHELWRWSNQSLFASVISAVDQQFTTKTKECDNLTICVSGSRQSYLIDLSCGSLVATTVIVISTVGCDLQQLELGRVTATISISLPDETATQCIHSPQICDLTSEAMIAAAESMVHCKLFTFEDCSN